MSSSAALRLALPTGVVLLAGCSASPIIQPSDGAPSHQINIDAIADAMPKSEPYSRYGNPDSYEVNGKTYTTLKSSSGHVERGIASWYGTKFHGRRTSSGEPYNLYEMTAAHKTLPLPTYALVTNLDNGRSVVVKINDRGPFHDDRILDLSYAAALKLDIVRSGTGRIELRALDAAPPNSQPIETTPPPPLLQQAAAEATPSPAIDQNLFLQVGAFSSFDNAESMRNRIGDIATKPITISKTDQPKPRYRVRIGPLSGDREAQRLAERLVDLGITQTKVVFDDQNLHFPEQSR